MVSKLAAYRLNKLADFLDNVSDTKRFSMNQVYRDGECGTVMCAAGWAGTIPEFNKAGLTLGTMGGLFLRGHEGEPLYSTCAIFFDIEKEQAEMLFGCPVGINTPQDWAASCRAFLKKNGSATVGHFKTFMDRVMVPVDTSEISVAVKSR